MAKHSESVFTTREEAEQEVVRLRSVPGVKNEREVYECIHNGATVYITAQNITYGLSRFAAHLRDSNIISITTIKKKVPVSSLLAGMSEADLAEARRLLGM